MIAPYPYAGPSYQPEELANRVADQLNNANEVSADIIETLLSSKKPLEEPLVFSRGNGVSLWKSACLVISDALEDEVESVIKVTPPNSHHNSIEIYTHEEVLENPTRILSLPAAAKAYQYGYWPTFVGFRADGYAQNQLNIDAESGLGVPQVVMQHANNQTPIEKDTELFDDGEAVDEFAQRVTNDITDWEKFVPWYRSVTLPSYRVETTAQSIAWSEFPDASVDRPTLDDRFSSSSKPRLGNFIRVAILDQLEEALPSIVNISTGPGQWTTDCVTLLVKPTHSQHSGIDRTFFCPEEALVKLAKYGYRLIDAWYDAPTEGYQQDELLVPRKLKFARGSKLQEWSLRTLSNASLFNEARHLNNFGVFRQELSWEELIPCLRAQTLTYEELFFEAEQEQHS